MLHYVIVHLFNSYKLKLKPIKSPNLTIDSDDTPMKWWKIHSTSYPVLAKLSIKYLCMCATSCYLERQFSTSDNIVTSSWSLLKPTKINMLVLLAQNLKVT